MSHAIRPRTTTTKLLSLVICLVLVTGLAWQYLSRPAYGAELGQRTLQLANDNVSASTTYVLSFDISTAGSLGSIQVQFCSNDPFPADPCTAPSGFTLGSAVLADQTGQTGFSISPASTANNLILTRSPASATVGAVQYTLNSVVNPNSSGSYYVRLQTFASTDATGSSSDYGGIAFAITNSLAISAEVPPYLIFCTGITINGLNCANAEGDYIDLGELSASHTSSGSSQMLVATNAASGYNVTVAGTTMTSGNNIINALSSGDVARPGVGQFGFNLRANTAPADGDDPSGPGLGMPEPDYDQPNVFRFASGDSIINNPVPDNIRLYTASYIVDVPASQPAGVYVSTLTYICLASF